MGFQDDHEALLAAAGAGAAGGRAAAVAADVKVIFKCATCTLKEGKYPEVSGGPTNTGRNAARSNWRESSTTKTGRRSA